MTLDIALTLAIVVGAAALLMAERFRVDAVALGVLALLLVLRLIDAEQALSGLSNPATVTIASMFVLSAGLQRTGTLVVLGRLLVEMAERRLLFLAGMMVVAGAASAFINNTPVVAVLIPVLMGVAARHKVNASQWLIPLSYSSQFGGVCTLMGTSTNLIVHSAAQDAGQTGFSMFEFSKLGVIMFGAGILYMLLVGRYLLPERESREVTEVYQLKDYITELRVLKNSELVGKQLKDVDWFDKHDVNILRLIRKNRRLRAWRRAKLNAGDILLVQGNVKDLMGVKEARNLEINPKFELKDGLKERNTVMVEALLAPRSRLAHKTLSELYFRRRYRMVVLALQRQGKTLRQRLDRVRLQPGDALLLQGPPQEIDRLRLDEDFIVLEEKKEAHFFRGRSPAAVAIVAAVVGLAGFTDVPIVVAALIGAIVMVLSGCLRLEDAYDAIDWRVIFLLAGILPLGVAMTSTGAAQWLVDQALGLVGHLGPVAALAMLYLLTAVLTEMMSNNAAAILLTPIAISTAASFGVDPKPLLLAITFAASTAFATPVGYQTNTMIYNPGGYKYGDFMKVGIPLNLIFWAIAVYFIPRFWPF